MKISHSSSSSSRLVAILTMAAALLFPEHGRADQLNLDSGSLGGADGIHDTPIVHDTQSASLYKASAGAHGRAIIALSYGSVDVSADAHKNIGDQFSPYYGSGGSWVDTYTITPTNPALMGTPGTARFTYSFQGAYGAVNDDGDNESGWQINLATTILDSPTGGNDGTHNGPIPLPLTLSEDVGFTFGSPFQVTVGASIVCHPGLGNSSADGKLSLHQNGLAVLSGGIDVDYTCTSRTGSAAGRNFSTGTSYSGFTLTNGALGAFKTAVKVLGGTAGAGRTLNTNFLSAPKDVSLASDVVNVGGTVKDKYVLQLSYDATTASAVAADPKYLVLLWLNPATNQWVNAVTGNTNLVGETNTPLAHQGAYNASFAGLGNYGVDTTHHTVWAVLDHTGQFAAIETVGKPNYMLFNPGTQETAIWTLNGAALAVAAAGPTLPAGFQLAAVADINQDGHRDFVLYNPTTRHTAIWYLNGAARTGTGASSVLPAGWSLVAAADFNGDAQVDYVLYNASTGQTAIWYLNAGAFVRSTAGPTVPAGWLFVGVADFNADGKPDFVLFNTSASSRQTAVWYMNGATIVSTANGPTAPKGYVLQAVGDFNGDGKPDYVLYNPSPSARDTLIWYLNGVTTTSGAHGPTLPSGFNLISP